MAGYIPTAEDYKDDPYTVPVPVKAPAQAMQSQTTVSPEEMQQFQQLQQIQQSQPQRKEEPGFLNKLASGAGNLLKGGVALAELPFQAGYEAATQNPLTSGREAIEGLREGVQNPISALSQYLPKGYQVPQYGPEKDSRIAQLMSMIPETAALGGVGRVAAGAMAPIGEAISGMAPGFLRGAANLGSKAVEPAAVGASAAGLSNQNLEEGAITQMLLSSILGGAGRMMPGGNMAKSIGGYGEKGRITSEEVEKNIASQPEGVTFPLSAIAQSPGLQATENILGAIPLSGMDKHLDAARVVNPQMLNKIAPVFEDSHKTPGLALSYGKQNYQDVSKQAGEAFTNLQQKAEQKGFKFDASNYYSEYDSLLNKAKKDLERRPNNTNMQKAVEWLESPDIAPTRTVNPATGKVTQHGVDTFTDAMSRNQNMNQIYNQENLIENPYLKGTYKQLKKSLHKDLDNQSINDPELAADYSNANKLWQQKSAFEFDSEGKRTPFYKKITGQSTTGGNWLDSYLKGSTDTADNSDSILNLVKILSRNSENVPESDILSRVASAYTRPSGKQADTTTAIKNRIAALNKPSRQALYGDNAKVADEMLSMYKSIPAWDVEGGNIKTGYTGSKMATALGVGATLAGALTGHSAGGMEGALIGTLAPLLGARGAAMALQSPHVQQALMKVLQIQERTGEKLDPSIIKQVLLGAAKAAPTAAAYHEAPIYDREGKYMYSLPAKLGEQEKEKLRAQQYGDAIPRGQQ